MKQDKEEATSNEAGKETDKEKGLLMKQAQEYKEALQRLQAEFENFRKRCDKENERFKAYANAELIKGLLPILDSFELAIKNTADMAQFVKGVEMIYAQLHSLLAGLGLKEIKAEGKQFDPYMHEVLLQDESDKDNIVLEELQKGYVLNDAVLRHSKVKVGKKKIGDAVKNDGINGGSKNG